MIMNLNSQGPMVETFYHGAGLHHHSHHQMYGSSQTALGGHQSHSDSHPLPTAHHLHESSPLPNYDLTLTPPGSNGAVQSSTNQTNGNTSTNSHPSNVSSNLSHNFTSGAIPPLHVHSHQEASLSPFYGGHSEMISPLSKSTAHPLPGAMTTFDLDRNAFLTTTTTEADSANESQQFHSDEPLSQPPSGAHQLTVLHSLDSTSQQLQPRPFKPHSIAGAEADFHDERVCFGCRESLNTSRFILSVSGYHNWHTDCLCCSECGESLCTSSTCYIHNGRMYCRADYQKLNECSKCHRTIGSSDWVRRAGDRLYHLACFACDLCQRQLSTGENFTVMRHSKQDTRLLCKLHFSVRGQEGNSNSNTSTTQPRLTHSTEERHLTELGVQTPPPSIPALGNTETIAPLQQTTTLASSVPPNSGLHVTTSVATSQPQQSHGVSQVTASLQMNGQISSGSRSSTSSQQSGNVSNGLTGSSSGGGSKTKRVRTTFTEDQLSVLQANFQLDSNPDGQDLERIAALTGLSKRVTQVWFQNSRARQKKYMSKSSRSGPITGPNGQPGGLMMSLRPDNGTSGASSTSGLWSPASSSGSSEATTMQTASQQSQQVVSHPVNGGNIKWRSGNSSAASMIRGLVLADDESLDNHPVANNVHQL